MYYVLNGPNLNMLGIREPDIYGHETYADLVNMIEGHAKKLNVEVLVKQTNSEGALVDLIQDAYFKKAEGVIINPGGYTHTSVAIADAISAIQIPTVEVHISDITKREAFRQHSFVTPVAVKTIMGQGLNGYLQALDYLIGLHK